MTTNIVPFFGHPIGGRPTCRVAPIEAKWIFQANQESSAAAARLHREAPALRAEIEARDHAGHELLERYAAVHQQHVALGLQGFHPWVPVGVYWALLLLAALLESPVNRNALAFLAIDDVGTWCVAGFLSVLNVLAASIFGKTLRQVGNKITRDWFVLGAVLLTAVGLMLALGSQRADYISFRAAADGMPTSSGTLATMVLLQALFFVIGSAFSFAMVPADPQLQRVLADKRALRAAIDQHLQHRTRLGARHDRLWQETEQAIAGRRHHCQGLIAEYRDHNMARRTTPAPSWLRQGVDLAVFMPVPLGERIGSGTPALAELIAAAEQRALSGMPA